MTKEPGKMAIVERHGGGFRILIDGTVAGKMWQFRPSADADCGRVNRAYSAKMRAALEEAIKEIEEAKDGYNCMHSRGLKDPNGCNACDYNDALEIAQDKIRALKEKWS